MTSRSKLLRIREVAEWLGVSQSAIYKWVQQGSFPAPVKFGGEDQKRMAARWVESEIEQWIKERKNETDSE